MASFIQEFKDFAIKGNALHLAIGVVIGAAFGKIVTSLVTDILNPLIGLLVGKIYLTGLFVSLDGKRYDSLAMAQAAQAPTLNYGIFLNNVIDFLLVALAIFIVIKQLSRFGLLSPDAKKEEKK